MCLRWQLCSQSTYEFLASKDYMRLDRFSFSLKGRDGRDGTPGPAGPAGKGIGHNRCSLQILQRQIANASLSSQSCLNHTGKDGRDGRQGPKGPRGYMGLKGISGSNTSTAGKAAWYTDRYWLKLKASGIVSRDFDKQLVSYKAGQSWFRTNKDKYHPAWVGFRPQILCSVHSVCK